MSGAKGREIEIIAHRSTAYERVRVGMAFNENCIDLVLGLASSVLLVPAVVSKDVSYSDAYTRSVAEIKKALPLAEELGGAIAIENVWNQFLLSPLEAVSYVDSFNSPMVRWHFDVGNVVHQGWPEHWIRVLGPRVAKVHVKEYSRKLRDTKGPRAGFDVEPDLTVLGPCVNAPQESP